jgi:hypothetical protein
MHFRQDAEIGQLHGTRVIRYQAEIDDQAVSPCGDFMRFNFASADGEPTSEIHGWIKIEDIVIDSVLEAFSANEWVRAANG